MALESCVNIKSKDFKILAKYHNVSGEKLEHIIHKYYEESGSIDYFPSDIYIKAELGSLPYRESGANVRKLWEREYNTPKTYDTVEERDAAILEAQKYFPKEAIIYYETNDGKYTVAVKKPVANKNFTTRDFTNNEELTTQEEFDLKLILQRDNIKDNTQELQFSIAENNKSLNHLNEYAESNTVIAATPKTSEELWEAAAMIETSPGKKTVTYTPIGKTKQTYTIEGNHIYNKEGEEVFPDDSKDRRKIFANLAVQEGRAVVVTIDQRNGDKIEHNDYIVNGKKQIISTKTGDLMKWGEENGVRKQILNEAEKAFRDIIEKDLITPQLIEYIRELGIPVHNRAELIQYLKDNGYKGIQEASGASDGSNPDIQMAIGGFVDKHSLPKGELPKLSSILSSKYGNNTAYGDVVYTADYEYTVIYRGVEDFDIIEYHLIDNNKNEKITDKEREGFRGSLNRMSSRDEITKGEYPSDNYHVTDGETTRNNAGLDSQASQGESQQTSNNASSKKHQGWVAIKRDSATGRIAFVENGKTIDTEKSFIYDDIDTYTTPQGEIYGFVDKQGDMYLDETVISPEHPIHEYTHLWDRAIAEKQPELWKRGVTLMQKFDNGSLWKEILDSDNYGKKWQAMEGMTPSKLESLVASEVHAKLMGKEGAKLLKEVAAKRGQKSIVRKLKQWMLDVWKSLKETFGTWTENDMKIFDGDVDKAIEYFNNLTMRDFATGVKLTAPKLLMEMGEELKSQQPSSQQQTQQEETSETPTQEMPNLAKVNGESSIEIDQDWKASELSILDKQLGEATTEESKEAIVDKIHDVQYADTEKEYYGSLTQKQSQEIRMQLGKYEKLNSDINTLQDNNLLSASEVTEVAGLIMDSLSDMITQIQQEPEIVKTWFPSLKLNEDVDLSKASRKEIVKIVGIQNLLDGSKKLFDSSEVDFDDSLTEFQADLIYQYWDAIVEMGRVRFAVNEHFGFKMNYKDGSHEVTEGHQLDSDDLTQYHDIETTEETEGDAQEHWQVEQRTIDVINTASELVRLAIHNCYEISADGKPVITKWGIKKRVDKVSAIAGILSWTQGAMTIEDMYNKLVAKQTKHTWLAGLTEKLNPNDKEIAAKNSDLQSQFFTVMCRPYQRYCIVQLENGMYAAKPLNDHPAKRDAKRAISAQFQVGEHPLFNYTDNSGYAKKGLNMKLLGTKENAATSSTFNLHRALYELTEITTKLDKGEELTEEFHEQSKDNIIGVCRILGFNPKEDIVDSIISKENVKYMTEKLRFIIKNLEGIKDVEFSKLKNPFEYKGAVEGSLSNFISPITDAMEEIMPNVIYDDGKLYQTYVTPSYLTLLFERFNNMNEVEIQKFMDEEYGGSEWFKDKSGWRNEMLRRLYTSEEARKMFAHTVELNFDGRRYMKTMSDSEYALSLFAHYWGENADAKDLTAPAWYRHPIMSNKPSSEFFRWYSYRDSSYKDNIVFGGSTINELVRGKGGGMYSMFYQEVDRIRTILMRNKSKTDIGYIKTWEENGKRFHFLPFLNPYLANDAQSKAAQTLLKDDTGMPSKDNKELARLIQAKIKGEEKMSSDDMVKLAELVKKAIMTAMDDKASSILDRWQKDGTLEAAKKIKYIAEAIKNISGDEAKTAATRELLENFIWNDHYAALNILQLTIGDIAAYKDADDLQKRLAQLHAPGIRPNVMARDYNGNRVSDGKYRTAVLQDFDKFKSNVLDNINEVFQRMIDRAPKNERKALIAIRDNVVKEYSQINVTDAQAYNSITSYRKKAFMTGKWSPEAEDVYNKLLKGNFTAADLKVAFQPLKPFVYAQLHKNVGVNYTATDGTQIASPIQNMPIPFQAKNAEYLLIMTGALIQGEEAKYGKLNKPNILRALSRIMEDSAYDGRTYDDKGNIVNIGTYNGRGIDTIQFNSAIKSGEQGALDVKQFVSLNEFMGDPNGEEKAYAFLKSQIYKYDADGNQTTEYDTDNFVHETGFDKWCLQQEVPAHFANHEQSQGSQERMIIPSDLEYYKNPYAEDRDNDANINKYKLEEIDAETGKTVTRNVNAKEIRKEYEETAAANIKNDVVALYEKLGVPFIKDGKVIVEGKTRAEQNIALSEILQEEILDSSRYGIDMFLACGLNEKGEFRIPKGDPIQAKRIEQLLNSIIKNRINKQEIAGGPIVQVSNFGTTKQLNIRFHTKDGGILKTKAEWVAEGNTEESYKEYTKNNQAGIAYFEVFLPAWMKSLYDMFADKDGNIDTDIINLLCPDLLKMISYRIPTEEKYSIAPMKAVGFMPAWAGDAIMFPFDLTSVDDSDFDVDKRYVMRKDIKVELSFEKKKGVSVQNAIDYHIRHNKEDIIKKLSKDIKLTANVKKEEVDAITEKVEKQIDLEKRTVERAFNTGKYSENKYNSEIERLEEKKEQKIQKQIQKLKDKKVADKISEFLDITRLMPIAQDDALMKEIRKAYLKYMFKVSEPTDIKTRNNNKLLNITWAILTNEMMAPQILNPGGFAPLMKFAYQIEAFKANQGNEALWNELNNMKLDDLEETSVNPYNDLTWIDTHIQFYKQNAEAASLLGICAVAKVAHAILAGNGIHIAINEICGKKPFTIGDITFTGRMELDPTHDINGNLIGKTLGMGVSASADAGKKNAWKRINVNLSTINVYNALLRLGMPFEQAGMFLSQKVLIDAITTYNRSSVTSKFKSLDKVIEEKIAEFEEEYSYTENSKINQEPLTKQDMIEGMTDRKHDEIDYKVLKAFQKVKAIADEIKKPTFVTRFNSISSAVGPLIIHNLKTQHQAQKFISEKDSKFYKLDGDVWVPVTMSTIFEDHPILEAFYQAQILAETLFKDMPAGSAGFMSLLNALPTGVDEKIWNSDKLLGDLSNFYQSYLIIQSGLIDENKLEYYIEEYPQKFINAKYQEKYKDNAFIQAIKPFNSSKTKRTFLNINTTGEQEATKDVYKSALIDLYKKDPKLVWDLFNYAFFRGGINFTPKTWMGLISTFIKERLKNDTTGKTYIDVYRNFDPVVNEVVIDQFFRNNWNDNTLVPKKKPSEHKYQIDYETGYLTVTNKEDVADLQGVPYFRTSAKMNGEYKTFLWKLIGSEKDNEHQNHRLYTRVDPLGDNNEYIEMHKATESEKRSIIRIDSMIQTTSDIADSNATETNDFPALTPMEEDQTLDRNADVIPDSEKIKDTSDLVDAVMSQWARSNDTVMKTRKDAEKKVNEVLNEFKQGNTRYKGFMKNVLAQKGIIVEESKVQDKLKELNLC